VAALGLIFLQWTLGDWQAQPTENWLSKVADTNLQALLRRCVGSPSQRPTASELAQRLQARQAPGESAKAQENPKASPSAPAAMRISAARAASPLTDAKMIGPYRLLDQLGEGGMGTVYLAEQRDPYRKVALKIIRSGLDGKLILSRFDAERQALAMMNHPNVAAVHESGLAADGRPYFAMEYIAGAEITKYCDAHHLNLSARIKLFLQVCDGVLHAHQKGVLHRDIKPSNLMVSSAPDSSGMVKVIDFGLAKSLHGKLAAHTLHTSFGAFIGTPIYSSPEHVSGAASGVDTRSDIYSMGVVLYELLAGMTPIASESLENLEPEKVREIVCKSKLPSMREQLQNTSVEKRKELAEHRAIKVDELPKTLEGDLSWVVGKCLERDPNDRYASALELKKDLERWLEMRPVEARPTTRWYRFTKLVRCNRGTSLLVGASLTTLLLTTTAAVIGFVRAESALKRAEAFSAEAEKAADFQVAQISSMNPQAMALSWRDDLLAAVTENSQTVKLDVKARGQTQHDLDQALKGVNFAELVIKQLNEHYFQPSLKLIERDYAKSPRLKATLLQSISSSMYGLGLVDGAIPPQKQAIAIRITEFGADAETTLASQVQLGMLLVDSSKPAEAETLLKDVVERTRRATGSDTAASLTASAQLGSIADGMGNLDQAEARFRDAWAGSMRLFGKDDPQTLGFAINLAHLLRKKRSLEEAEPIIASAYTELLRASGPTNPSTIEAMREFAQLRLNQSRFQEAMELGAQAVKSAETAYGRYSLLTISTVNDMGLYLRAMGQHAKALAQFQDAFARYEKIAFTGFDVLITQLNMGTSLFELGRLQESDSYLQPVLDEVVQQAGWDSDLTLATASRLANLRIAQGRFVEAQTLLSRIIERRTQSPNPHYAAIAMAHCAMGQTLLALGKTDEAKQALSAATEASQKIIPAQTAITLRIQLLLAQTLPASGPAPNGVSVLKETVAKQADETGVSATDKVEALLALSRRLNDLGQSQEALPVASQGVDQARQALSNDHYLLAGVLIQQARAAAKRGDKAAASKMFIEARRIIDGSATLNPMYRLEADQLAIHFGFPKVQQ
jgi:eukaryotic-like serine/threonine-protein kinase